MATQNPVLASIRCAINNGKYTVTITWTPIQGSTYFYAGVFNPQNQSVAHSVVDSSHDSYVANIQNITLDPNTAYTVKVAQCDAHGTLTSAYSRPWNLLQNPLGNLTVYNNLTSLSISATLPTVGIATGIDATLVDSHYDPMANGLITGASGVLPVDVPLDSSKTYTLYVNPVANGGTNQGPSSSLPLVMTSVRIGRVTYDGNNMDISPVTPLTSNKLAGWLTAGDETIVSNTGSASSVSLTKDWTQLDLSYKYTVLLRVVNGTSYGPSSNVTPVMVAPPDLASASYVGGKVGVTWDVPPILPKPTGGTVAALVNGSVAGKPTDVLGYKESIDISSVKPTSSLSVRVNSKYGVAYGPPASANIPFTAPTISSVSVADGFVNVAWSAVADAPGYRVYLNDSNGNPITFLDTTDTGAALSASLNAASGYKVSVQAYGTSNGILLSGPVSVAVDAIAAALETINFSTDARTGLTTVKWNAVEGASEYTLYLEPGHQKVTVKAPNTSYNLPDKLIPNSERSVTIGYSKKIDTCTISSPQSNPFVIPTGQPVLTAVEYDGQNVSASWEAVPNATGYVATLIGTKEKTKTVAGKTTTKAGITSAAIPFPNPVPETTYTVLVQALFTTDNIDTADSGPVSNSMPVFTAGFFLSTANFQTAAPYFYPATSLAMVTSPPTAEEISLFFPELGSAKLTSLPIKVPTATPTFVLQANSGANSATYPYQLIIDKSSPVWKFDTTAVRPAIKTDVPALLIALENANASPWGINMVREALSRYLPQTFQESLFLAYGMDGGSSAADLRPGMVLRVGVSTLQSSSFADNQQLLNGYSGGPVLEYDIGSFLDATGKWSIGFDSFIGELVSQNLLSVEAPEEGTKKWNQQSGVADAADLYYSSFPSSFYRLLPPQILHNTTNSCSSDTTKQFVIAAADKYSEIVQAKNTTGGTCPIAYFRGRTIIRLAIRVTLNGNEILVPVGTIIANLLERSGCSPSLADANLKGLTVRRFLGPVVTDETAPLSTSDSYRIRLDWKNLSTFNPGWTALSLPLLPGDSVKTR